MIKQYLISEDVSANAETSMTSRLLERLGLVSRNPSVQSTDDELGLLSTRAWTLARGDAMLRRFL
jgi:hypothetical protein